MDDSTIIHLEPTSDTPLEEMFKLAQKGLNLFSGAAKAKGGQVIEENIMVSNGLQMAPRREMASVIQGSYTYTPITRRRK